MWLCAKMHPEIVCQKSSYTDVHASEHQSAWNQRLVLTKVCRFHLKKQQLPVPFGKEEPYKCSNMYTLLKAEESHIVTTTTKGS